MMVNEGSASSGGSGFEEVKPATYIGTCYKMIDLGTQRNDYQGTITHKRQVFLAWELTEKMADGRPFQVAAWLTMSLHEKATLRKFLEAWRGRPFEPSELEGFDLSKVLGTSCLVVVGATKTGKAKVTGVSRLVAGTPRPQLVNPTVYFSIDNFDRATFDSLPGAFKSKIEASPEYRALMGAGPSPLPGDAGDNSDTSQSDSGNAGYHDEDIPF